MLSLRALPRSHFHFLINSFNTARLKRYFSVVRRRSIEAYTELHFV